MEVLVDGNNFLSHYIKTDNPCAVGKIGGNELQVLYCYVLRQEDKNIQYPPDLIRESTVVAGINPYSPEQFDLFATEFLANFKHMSAVAVWSKLLISFEEHLVMSAGIFPISLTDIEPYYHAKPWSHKLKDKNVLVISPFADSIQKQYLNRQKIWPDGMLPEFNLKTIKYPHSSALDNTNPLSTFHRISQIQEQMDKIDYDVAIIGTGATSLFFAVHAKQKGKVGIHMGGATQILFGIKGKRWDDPKEQPAFQKFFNEYWVRPSKEETPENVSQVEGGCYW